MRRTIPLCLQVLLISVGIPNIVITVDFFAAVSDAVDVGDEEVGIGVVYVAAIGWAGTRR